MKIGKKLYVNFGAVLAMVLVLFLVNLIAVRREHSAKAAASQALGLADATDAVKFQMMQNRLYLSNYLLSGDSREVDRMNDGLRMLTDKLQSTENLAESEQQNLLRNVLASHAGGELVLAIGPEGGWAEDELQLFLQAGWISASLGPTILRAETAAIAAAAITISELT